MSLVKLNALNYTLFKKLIVHSSKNTYKMSKQETLLRESFAFVFFGGGNGEAIENISSMVINLFLPDPRLFFIYFYFLVI